MRRAKCARKTELMLSLRTSIVVAALVLAGSAQARPRTTKPLYVLTVHVTITDTRVTLDPNRAPRGVQARFVINNAGSRARTFTLSGGAAAPGFSRVVKPHQRDVVTRFLDFRGKAIYKADPGRPGMRGIFIIS